jgi:NAD-dependent deacetylase
VHTIEFNLEETAASFAFDETRAGKAGDTVPAWVEELLR